MFLFFSDTQVAGQHFLQRFLQTRQVAAKRFDPHHQSYSKTAACQSFKVLHHEPDRIRCGKLTNMSKWFKFYFHFPADHSVSVFLLHSASPSVHQTVNSHACYVAECAVINRITCAALNARRFLAFDDSGDMRSQSIDLQAFYFVVYSGCTSSLDCHQTHASFFVVSV